MKKLTIAYEGTHPAVAFAARELAKYLKKASVGSCTVSRRGDAAAGADFLLGTCEDLALTRRKGVTAQDDWILIKPCGKSYLISGSNPRSVLFAVYRYLFHLGFRWIRPGKAGEIIPKLRSPRPRKPLRISDVPSYAIRSLCIEGATSYEHVRDLIDWQAKQGMNSYFIQFHNGTYFFKRWYEHADNPFWEGQPFSDEDAESTTRKIIRDLQRRGLQFERMGHGWTCHAVGIEGEGWDATQQRTPKKRKHLLAEVDGKRGLWKGVALNTNLCYSDPEARGAVTEAIAQYAEAHPEVDALHFWLADGSNNNCECKGCRKRRLSDFYVDMLNELDDKLSARNLATKIVFLIYVDLLWPPVRARIKNQDRFILMFAPITRSYTRSFCAAGASTEHATRYAKNKLKFPKDAGANIEYLEMWQKDFKGLGVDFDYHIIWPCYYDLSHVELARVLHQDVRNLSQIGLHGFISCQNQRVSFPHNLLMDVLARTLWNKRASFAGILRDTFADAYGKDGVHAAEFLAGVSRLSKPFFEPVYVPVPDPRRIAAGLRNIPKVRALAEAFAPVVQRNMRIANGAVLRSWQLLAAYLRMLDLWLPAVEAYLRRSPDCRGKFEAYFEHLWRQEKKLHRELDVSTYVKVLQWRLNEAESKE